MKKNEFIKELKKLGFINNDIEYKHPTEWEEADWFDHYKLNNIKVDISNVYGIDQENEIMFPYILILNDKTIIGHKRCLSYIKKLISNG